MTASEPVDRSEADAPPAAADRARELRADLAARRDAGDLLAEADAVVAEAQRVAEAVVEEARLHAEVVVREAHDRAQAIAAEAQQVALGDLAERADLLVGGAQERVRTLDAELAATRAALTALLGDLDVLREHATTGLGRATGVAVRDPRAKWPTRPAEPGQLAPPPGPSSAWAVQAAAPATPADEPPPDGAPLDQAPLDQAPLDQAPLDQAPLDQAPLDQAVPDRAALDEGSRDVDALQAPGPPPVQPAPEAGTSQRDAPRAPGEADVLDAAGQDGTAAERGSATPTTPAAPPTPAAVGDPQSRPLGWLFRSQQ